ncbi:MAG: creatininase family protein [Sedimentisphaerales bacterium]|nr:creatininase family protein [Sedimentisphaerales bacterium]
MNRRFGRREFLGGITGTVLTGSVLGQSKRNETESAKECEVRLEFLRPGQIEKSQKVCPTIFQPLGTIEWHGVHNVVGVDAVKAHALCVKAAQQGGGVVSPPLYGGVGGLSEPHTFVMDPEDSVYSNLLRPWLEQLCREMARDGFKAIIILTGHYGAAQQIVVRETAVRMSRALGIPVLGTPEYFLALDEGYTGDHAAWGETTLMMQLYPETVALSELGDPPYRGVFGRDPKEATKDDGKRIAETIVSRLATLARKMPKWDYETLDRFIEAEAALVARQLSAPRGENAVWTAWQNAASAMHDYGRLLAEERFEKIKAAVSNL